SSSDEIGRQITVEVSPATAAGVTIKTRYPEIHRRGESISYSVDLDVTVPANAPLLVKNRFGSIDAAGVRAASEFVNAQGSIDARDFSGRQRIENSFGSIKLQNSGGDTTLVNSNGSVTEIGRASCRERRKA